MEWGESIMGTTLRAELSEKNPYWISKHRYYELKHFCLQYPSWQKAYAALDGLGTKPADFAIFVATNTLNDPTSKYGIAKAYYSERIDMVERAAKTTDLALYEYILNGVTNGWSYDVLKARLNIPCSKDIYYDLYRKFFWFLHIERR